MGAELFHADGQTNMKLTVVFRSFANAPKNEHKQVRKHASSKILGVVTYNYFENIQTDVQSVGMGFENSMFLDENI